MMDICFTHAQRAMCDILLKLLYTFKIVLFFITASLKAIIVNPRENLVKSS